MNFYSVFKYLAFTLDPEKMHDFAIKTAHHFPRIIDPFNPLKNNTCFELNCAQLNWSFPVGLAAGFDKNAQAIKFFERMGFGAIEVGTITKEPQIGNQKPRIKRHANINSLQNSMGFPNDGSFQILKNINMTSDINICLGVNIGKNKDTNENETAIEYAFLYKKFAPVCDYLVVNISSPNTPGLRSFQKKELLEPILSAIKSERDSLLRPVFIKIAPDLSHDDLKMICELSKEFGFSGIVATNTTIQHNFGPGGLSGQYIKNISKSCREKACEYLREDNSQTVIGVGGIDCYQDIKDFWKMGGSFTQIYTALIYQGPQLLKQIAKEMQADIKKYQLDSVQSLWQNIKEID